MKASRTSLLLLFAAALVPACEEPEIRTPPPPPVVVAEPLVEDVVVYEIFSGKTEAFETVEVRARVEGVLLEIAHEEGLPVKAGELMFRVDPAPFTAARDAAQAHVTSAEAQAELADITATKLENAYEERAVSELQALEARAKHNVAVQDVEVARKNLAIKELELSYTEVTAPISGLVNKSDYFVGSLVGGFGSAALTTVVDDTRVRVWFTVPDRVFMAYLEQHGIATRTEDPKAVMPKIELAREIDEGFPIIGQIDYADPEVDIETGTLRLRAVIENADGRLRGGLFVRVRMTVDELEDALVVPEIAVGRDQQGQYIYVVGDGDVVQRRAITQGPRTGNGIVIEKGVERGERVVVEGLLFARPGAQVSPRTIDRKDA